jgi:hypothetical protein
MDRHVAASTGCEQINMCFVEQVRKKAVNQSLA